MESVATDDFRVGNVGEGVVEEVVSLLAQLYRDIVQNVQSKMWDERKIQLQEFSSGGYKCTRQAVAAPKATQ